jgi:hypothetical protein
VLAWSARDYSGTEARKPDRENFDVTQLKLITTLREIDQQSR